MPSRRLGLLLVLFSQLLGGCAYLSSLQGDVAQRVDDWVAREEYGKALDTLAYVRPDHPDYRNLQNKQKQVAAAAERYAERSVLKAGQLSREGKWEQALALYDEALDHYPRSKTLHAGLEQLHQRQAGIVAEQDLELLELRGEWLARSRPLYATIARVQPRERAAQRRLEQVQAEVEQVAAELGRHGLTALAQNDLTSARRLLSLSERLHPSPAVVEANRKLRRIASGQRQERRTELVERYREVFAAGDLIQARQLMQQLLRLDGGQEEIAELQRQLQATLAGRVRQLMERGEDLYSRRRFEQAIGVWRQALELEPDNEQARGQIERAERVLENLQRIEQKQRGE